MEIGILGLWHPRKALGEFFPSLMSALRGLTCKDITRLIIAWFLCGKSTETTIYKFVELILHELDEHKNVLGILYDLRKAFDNVSHSIMLKKLCHYGISGKALDWLSSYLSGRSQFVCIKGPISVVSSNKVDVGKGIPQHSLGLSTGIPALLVVHVNDLPMLKNQLHLGIFTEIVPVLREWQLIWKELYKRRDRNFMKIRNMMCDLISYHDTILSGKLTNCMLSELKCLIASVIDTGNRILGLDMVVRSEEGNILPVKSTSAMKLFLEHDLASARVRQSLAIKTLPSMKDFKDDKKNHSYALLVSLMNFCCIVEDDLELILTLYDTVSGCPISDNFVFLWKPNGYDEEMCKLQQLRILFTDLVQLDTLQKEVYLVCYAIRIDRVEHRRSEYVESLGKQTTSADNFKTGGKKSKVKCKRRPYGVAAVDISSYLKISSEDLEEDHVFLPLLRYSEGSMKNLLNRIISIKNTALEECGGQGLWFRIKFLNSDPREAFPMNHLKMENVIQIPKIGLPEVIMPTYVRNELFITLIGGEFSRFLAPDKNVEVAVCVCGEDGKNISGAIQFGNKYLKEYRSVIYYRESKPEWYETLKINMPLSGFRGCYLKFTFTHRSAIYNAEKPFAMSLINIMKNFGTLLEDGKHILNVFRIDHKRFEEDSCPYQNLPAKPSDVELKKNHAKGLKLCEKDRFFMQTYVCSTKLTQNMSILRLLDWMHNNHKLMETLQSFLKVDGSEIIKFLPDILDTLFKILEEPLELMTYGVTVFNCLIYVLDMLTKKKYEHFLPVLNMYIEERFHALAVYKKLIAILSNRLTDYYLPIIIKVKIMRSLYYYGRFILRSWSLCHGSQETDEKKAFIISIEKLLSDVINLCCNKKLDRKTQRTFLKFSYSLIFNIEESLKSEETVVQLCCVLQEFIGNFGNTDVKDSIMIINEIVESKIFFFPKWRCTLTPVLLEKLMEYLNNDSEVELCVNGLNGLLEPFQLSGFNDEEIQNHTKNMSALILSLLESVIEAIIRLKKGSVVAGKLLALMIEILRQMTPDTFICYRDYFPADEELLDFLMAVLIFFQELISRPLFSSDWIEMIMLQNSVILKSLKCIAFIIEDRFLERISHQVWNSYFICAVTFISQSFLQLEDFSEKKCAQILLAYMDMRLELAIIVKDMWSSLGKHQGSFTPNLIGPFIEVALIPNATIQEVIIPIFFDMAQCEFYSSASVEDSCLQSSEFSTHQKLNFYEVELTIASMFDKLIESGKGDEFFKDQFCSIMNPLFDECEPMKIEGRRFMNGVKEQLEKLLECRHYIEDDGSDIGMICLFQLLELYGKRNYQQLYVHYVSKLCDWHLKNCNYAEAGKTLNLHAQLLDWSGDAVPPDLRYNHFPTIQTCFELKEILYHDIIKYFDQGRMWLCAIKVCEELAEVYENLVYNYSKLADVLRKKSDFYEKIRTTTFPEIEYFYVSYSGLVFPKFLQNKTFVYRGYDFEGYQNFCGRIKNQFPNAHIISGLQGEDATKSFQLYIQIIKIFPEFDETDQYSVSQIPEKILYHLHENEIQKFRFPCFKSSSRCALYDEQHISAPANGSYSTSKEKHVINWNSRTVVVTSQPFPWCLKLSPVLSVSTYEVCPLRTAMEEIRAVNRSLFGILPFEIGVSQNLKYVYSKLEEIVDNSFVKRLNKGIKVIMKENKGNLVLLRKLEGLLMEQMDLISVFTQNFNSLDALGKLIFYLKRCVNKLTLFCNESMESNSTMTPQPNELAAESEAATQQLLKKISSKREKRQTHKSVKLSSLFRDVQQSKDGNSSWYVPTPSFKLNEISFSTQFSTNLKKSKSVFHVPTPVSHIIPSLLVPSSPLSLEFPSETYRDSFSNSENIGMDECKSIDSRKKNLDDLLVNINFTFKKNELIVPDKEKANISCDKIQWNIDDATSDVPPPLPPKARNHVTFQHDSTFLSCIKNEGILRNRGIDYVNLSGDMPEQSFGSSAK